MLRAAVSANTPAIYGGKRRRYASINQLVDRSLGRSMECIRQTGREAVRLGDRNSSDGKGDSKKDFVDGMPPGSVAIS